MPGESHAISKFDTIKTIPLCLVSSISHCAVPWVQGTQAVPCDSLQNEGRKNRKKKSREREQNQETKEEWALCGGKARGEEKPNKKK